MKPQTVHVIKEIVRFFIGCYNRGNATTANTKTVHAEICKQLKITRQANKNNHYGLVVECLRVLKSKIVLFETTAPKENDVLHEIVTVDNRRIYGLTSAAEKYLTDPVKPGEEELPMCSDKFITKMLQHFDVLPQSTGRQSVQQPEEETMPANNIERLVATVRNRSAAWPAKSTPADFLGGMYALSQQTTGDTADMLASAEKLDWPDRPISRRQNYTACRDFLIQQGLLASGGERKRRQGNREISVLYGVKLTPLGIEVAIAGDFKDQRPAAERGEVSVPQPPQKAGTMLKGQKQQPAEPVAATSDVTAETKEMLQTIAALQQRLAALESRQPTPAAAETVTPAEVEPVEYSEKATMSMVLRDAVPAIIASFQQLIDSPDSVDEQDGEPATHVNVSGLYLTLTELEKTVHGIKAYVSECMANNKPVDLELLTRYAESYRTAAENLEEKSTLPKLGDRVLTKRFFIGGDAVSHPLWKRPATTRA